MIPVREARERVLARIRRVTAAERVRVQDALGRVLAADVVAPFDVPPHTNSAVDGYAIAREDIPGAGQARLAVIADLPAGQMFAGAVRRGQAVRIMTGAPMPEGTDTSVPQEDVARMGDAVLIPAAAVPGGNVRLRGEDIPQGAVVLEAGAQLRPQDLGLISSLGLAEVQVRARPRVAVLSTGDEVAEPGGPKAVGQIYDSNRVTLAALVRQIGCEPLDLGIVRDARDDLRDRLLHASRTADVVLTSGGVSVGVYDLVKEVLAEIGSIDFWQVNMTPGRPLAPGTIGDAYFFGLPGNPVASTVAFLLFVRPALWKLMGRRALDAPRFAAACTSALRKKAGRMEYKRGILRFAEGGWEVSATGPQGSGILRSMVLGNCLIVLEEERGDVKEGDVVTVEPFVALW
ncbi:MAG TPA: gephyrin-like molybdotransferase Glp [Candidatus Methylomirabilis sp.]